MRAGSADWECSKGLAAAADSILTNALSVNLIWRVGRVEATVRKVTLACGYALLKAGAIKPEVWINYFD